MRLIIATREIRRCRWPPARQQRLTELREATCASARTKRPAFSTSDGASARRRRHCRARTAHRRLDCRPAIGRHLAPGSAGCVRLYPGLQRQPPFCAGLSIGRGLAASAGQHSKFLAAHLDPGPAVRPLCDAVLLDPAAPGRPPWKASSAPTYSSCRWTASGAGIAITISLPSCCGSGCRRAWTPPA